MSTRAQEVRAKVLACKAQSSIEEEAQSLFDWIVDSVDKNDGLTKSGVVNAYMVINSNSFEIRHFPGLKFTTKSILDKDGITKLFEATKSLIDNEEGYDACINKANIHKSGESTECIAFDVTIK